MRADHERAFQSSERSYLSSDSLWLGRHRRLSKDYEYCVQTSEAMLDVAAIRLLLNRLTAV